MFPPSHGNTFFCLYVSFACLLFLIHIESISKCKYNKNPLIAENIFYLDVAKTGMARPVFAMDCVLKPAI